MKMLRYTSFFFLSLKNNFKQNILTHGFILSFLMKIALACLGNIKKTSIELSRWQY